MPADWFANASALEITWSAVAVGGFAFAAVFWALIFRSLLAVNEWIRQGHARRWGPRHAFVLGFLIGIGLLVLVWLGFIALGANAIFNPPPATPDREAASERGGWILTALEAVLFLFQLALLYAWVAVGGPSIKPNPVSKVHPS